MLSHKHLQEISSLHHNVDVSLLKQAEIEGRSFHEAVGLCSEAPTLESQYFVWGTYNWDEDCAEPSQSSTMEDSDNSLLQRIDEMSKKLLQFDSTEYEESLRIINDIEILFNELTPLREDKSCTSPNEVYTLASLLLGEGNPNCADNRPVKVSSSIASHIWSYIVKHLGCLLFSKLTHFVNMITVTDLEPSEYETKDDSSLLSRLLSVYTYQAIPFVLQSFTFLNENSQMHQRVSAQELVNAVCGEGVFSDSPELIGLMQPLTAAVESLVKPIAFLTQNIKVADGTPDMVRKSLQLVTDRIHVMAKALSLFVSPKEKQSNSYPNPKHFLTLLFTKEVNIILQERFTFLDSPARQIGETPSDCCSVSNTISFIDIVDRLVCFCRTITETVPDLELFSVDTDGGPFICIPAVGLAVGDQEGGPLCRWLDSALKHCCTQMADGEGDVTSTATKPQWRYEYLTSVLNVAVASYPLLRMSRTASNVVSALSAVKPYLHTVDTLPKFIQVVSPFFTGCAGVLIECLHSKVEGASDAFEGIGSHDVSSMLVVLNVSLQLWSDCHFAAKLFEEWADITESLLGDEARQDVHSAMKLECENISKLKHATSRIISSSCYECIYQTMCPCDIHLTEQCSEVSYISLSDMGAIYGSLKNKYGAISVWTNMVIAVKKRISCLDSSSVTKIRLWAAKSNAVLLEFLPS
eukprot:Tbor_TRINITY_DN5237_c0_g1::TRINITY_DN5237_c0_g1_i1::g.16201::m.16201